LNSLPTDETPSKHTSISQTTWCISVYDVHRSPPVVACWPLCVQTVCQLRLNGIVSLIATVHWQHVYVSDRKHCNISHHLPAATLVSWSLRKRSRPEKSTLEWLRERWYAIVQTTPGDEDAASGTQPNRLITGEQLEVSWLDIGWCWRAMEEDHWFVQTKTKKQKKSLCNSQDNPTFKANCSSVVPLFAGFLTFLTPPWPAVRRWWTRFFSQGLCVGCCKCIAPGTVGELRVIAKNSWKLDNRYPCSRLDVRHDFSVTQSSPHRFALITGAAFRKVSTVQLKCDKMDLVANKPKNKKFRWTKIHASKI
jgi:hypothetical protein